MITLSSFFLVIYSCTFYHPLGMLCIYLALFYLPVCWYYLLFFLDFYYLIWSFLAFDLVSFFSIFGANKIRLSFSTNTWLFVRLFSAVCVSRSFVCHSTNSSTFCILWSGAFCWTDLALCLISNLCHSSGDSAVCLVVVGCLSVPHFGSVLLAYSFIYFALTLRLHFNHLWILAIRPVFLPPVWLFL